MSSVSLPSRPKRVSLPLPPLMVLLTDDGAAVERVVAFPAGDLLDVGRDVVAFTARPVVGETVDHDGDSSRPGAVVGRIRTAAADERVAAVGRLDLLEGVVVRATVDDVGSLAAGQLVVAVSAGDGQRRREGIPRAGATGAGDGVDRGTAVHRPALDARRT